MAPWKTIPAHWRQALPEWISGVLISSCPIWLGALIIVFLSDRHFQDLIEGGELFMYSTTILAPVLYLTGGEWHGRTFRGRLFLIISSAIVLMVASAFFSLHRAQVILPPESIGLIVVFALIVVLIALSLQLMALASEKQVLAGTDRYASSMREQEQDMAHKLGS